MCSAVWQPFEDGDDSFCGPACIAAFNAKLKEEYDEGLALLEEEEEELPEPREPLPVRRREGEQEVWQGCRLGRPNQGPSG